MSSFNIDMDRYLERRSLGRELDRPRKKSLKIRNSTNNSSDRAILNRFKEAIKVLLDADEVINLESIKDLSDSSVYDRKSFRERLSELVKSKSYRKNSSNESKSKQNGDMYFIEDTESKNTNSNTMNQGKKFTSKYDDSNNIPIEEVNRVISSSTKERDNFQNNNFQAKTSSFETIRPGDETLKGPNASFGEFRDDLREVIRITYRIMRNVPSESIKEFRASSDYKKYVDILDKYDLLKKRPDNL